jgi:hypothetical protein
VLRHHHLCDCRRLVGRYQFDHNDSPARGAKQNDYRYLAKLGYAFNGDENDWFQ